MEFNLKHLQQQLGSSQVFSYYIIGTFVKVLFSLNSSRGNTLEN